MIAVPLSQLLRIFLALLSCLAPHSWDPLTPSHLPLVLDHFPGSNPAPVPS